MAFYWWFAGKNPEKLSRLYKNLFTSISSSSGIMVVIIIFFTFASSPLFITLPTAFSLLLLLMMKRKLQSEPNWPSFGSLGATRNNEHISQGLATIKGSGSLRSFNEQCGNLKTLRKNFDTKLQTNDSHGYLLKENHWNLWEMWDYFDCVPK